jgi:beta-glucosidase
VVIVFATRPEEEGMDAIAPDLPYDQDALIAAVGAANPVRPWCWRPATRS